MFHLDTQKPEDGFFAVAAVTTSIDTDGGKFASFAPAFDGELGNSQQVGNFGHGHQIGKVVDTDSVDFFANNIGLGSSFLCHKIIL